MENNLKKRLAAGEVSLCMGLRQARTVDIGPLVGAAGFDCLYVDMEHSPISFDTTSAICITAVAYGVTPLVRVPGHLGQDISRALDGGAQGVILPHVNTPEQALDIVSHAKYPPVGHRSVMGAGPATAYKAMPLAQVNASGNADTMVIIMLETPEGIANADAIMLKELRRLGGLLKHIHNQSAGAYSQATASAIAELRVYIQKLSSKP